MGEPSTLKKKRIIKGDGQRESPGEEDSEGDEGEEEYEGEEEEEEDDEQDASYGPGQHQL